MSGIVEILGEKKFSGSTNTSLSTRVLFEENSKIRYDNNMFFSINQETQYGSEKETSNIYRVYGKLNPIFNFKTKYSTNNGINIKKLELNNNNWYFAILKPTRYDVGTDINGNTLYSKGIREIKKTIDNNTILDIDLRNGLPGKSYINSKEDNLFGIVFLMGHNFVIGDKIYITSIKNNTPPTGIYNIKRVLNNIIFIDFPALIIGNELGGNSIIDEASILINEPSSTSGTSVTISNIETNTDDILNLINERPSISQTLQPDLYVSKLLNKEKLQYYIKTLEVVDVINNIDDCGFSINAYNEQIKTFTTQNDINLDNAFDNVNEPLTNLYFGIIKKYDANSIEFTDLESHFNTFIDSLAVNDGLELLSNVKNTPNIVLKKGDIFYHSLCEYSQEDLTETELQHINHRFIYNNLIFNYNPFSKLVIKLKSSYIEDADINNQIPSYSVYSRQRDKYIWRDILSIGVSDEDGNVINHPYLNGAYYVYANINFFLKTEKNKTPKYNLNVNDLNNSGNSDVSEINNILNQIVDEVGVLERIKPFSNFKDQKC